jgi:uncharacterized protein YlxW (UPF0749 family)
MSDAAQPAPSHDRAAWRRLLVVRGWRSELAIAALMALLGVGLAVTVRAQSGPSGLALANQDDLTGILADLSGRDERLQTEISSLSDTEQRLRDSSGTGIALEQAQTRAADLGILAGTLPAQGPGIVVRVTDPKTLVPAAVLLDAVEELRDAGAEAIDISSVRVATATSVEDRDGGVTVDGHALAPPYVLTVIGDPNTLEKALEIPGGITDEVATAGSGANATITVAMNVRITSLRPPQTFHYARAAP